MSTNRRYTPFEQRLAKRWLRNFLRKKLRLDVPQEMINLIASFNTWGWDFEDAKNGPYAIDPSTPGMAVLCENTTIANALSKNWFISSSFHFEKGFKYKFTIRNHKKTENEWVFGMKRVTDVAPDSVHNNCHSYVYSDGFVSGRELCSLEVDCTGDEMNVQISCFTFRIDSNGHVGGCELHELEVKPQGDAAWQLCVAGTESGTRFEIEHAEVCGADESFEDDDVVMQ